MSARILPGDCRDVLPTLAAGSVQCVVTSPPYYGLRDYGTAQWDGGDAGCSHTVPLGNGPKLEAAEGYDSPFRCGSQYTQQRVTGLVCKCGARRIDRQIGLEPTPEAFIAEMVAVFRLVRRVLRDDGTVWANLGDSFAAKQLLMMPARVALALQADGWILRSDIIWAKPNPMPESVTDRPTSAHEHVFLLTKAARYFYDAEAVAEPSVHPDDDRKSRSAETQKRMPSDLIAGIRPGSATYATRSCRNVWTIPTHAYSAAHFATFPPALAERCIKAGSRPGDTVLDPFAGAGTTLLVADRLQRSAIGIELNPDYTRLAMARCRDDAPLFTSWPPAEDPADVRMGDLFAEAGQ